MKEYTKAEVDDMREMLANSEWEGLRDRDLREVLWDGCVGWNNMTKEQIVENWENIYGELGD
jgi:hypothetical protein